MRPLEILLSITNLLALFILAIPQFFAIHWISYLALITVLTVGAQLLAEGSRWEMSPAYALAGLLLLVWLQHTFTPTGGKTDQFGIGLSVSLGTLELASIALPMILPVFRFPRPTGPYQIGTATYYWVDTSRHEIFSTDPTISTVMSAE